LLGAALTATGCGPGFKVVPVSGKITVNGEAIQDAEATILFRPDASKGNTGTLDFAGVADEDGNYELYYGDGKRGAAPGWYKVAAVVNESLRPKIGPNGKRKKPAPGPGIHVHISLIDPKYAVPTSSGIEIEVVENPAPGAYDLNLIGPAKK
jgi:hypothetical protein